MWVLIILHNWFILSVSNPKQSLANIHIVWTFHGYKFKIVTRIVGQRYLVNFNMRVFIIVHN